MAHLTVEIAIRGHLSANLAGITAAPIYDEGQFDAPADGSPFLVLQFPFSESRNVSIDGPGGRWHEETGGARVVINVRRKGGATTGPQAGKLWAKQIADLFRDAEIDGVQVWSPSSPTTDDSNDESGYYRLALVIPYTFPFQQED